MIHLSFWIYKSILAPFLIDLSYFSLFVSFSDFNFPSIMPESKLSLVLFRGMIIPMTEEEIEEFYSSDSLAEWEN